MTNVPNQALALLNDPFVVQQADVWAGRLLASDNSSLDSRLQRMFQTGLSRSPTEQERLRFRRAVLGLAELHHVQATDILKNRPVWKDVAHAILNLSEFRTIP